MVSSLWDPIFAFALFPELSSKGPGRGRNSWSRCESLEAAKNLVEFSEVSPMYTQMPCTWNGAGLSLQALRRYDNLVGMFSNKQIPAVGISLGVERIFAILEQRYREQARSCDGNIRETKTQVRLVSLHSFIPLLSRKSLTIFGDFMFRRGGLSVIFPFVNLLWQRNMSPGWQFSHSWRLTPSHQGYEVKSSPSPQSLMVAFHANALSCTSRKLILKSSIDSRCLCFMLFPQAVNEKFTRPTTRVWDCFTNKCHGPATKSGIHITFTSALQSERKRRWYCTVCRCWSCQPARICWDNGCHLLVNSGPRASLLSTSCTRPIPSCQSRCPMLQPKASDLELSFAWKTLRKRYPQPLSYVLSILNCLVSSAEVNVVRLT